MNSEFFLRIRKPVLSSSSGARLLTLFLVGSSIVLAGCTSTLMIQSEVASTPVTIDGDLGEWSMSMQQMDDNPLRVGVKHDDDFVYLSIQSIDETFLRQVMLGGMTIWFNSGGDKTKDLGITFPIGRTSMSPIRVDPDNAPSSTDQTPRLLRELEVVGSDGKGVRYPVEGVPGLSLKAFLEFGSFSYELKIPIETSAGFQVAVNPGANGVFGFGLETGEIDMGQLAGARGDTSGAAMGGGRGGRSSGGRGGRGGGGRGGGGRGGGGVGGLEPVEIWVQVSLGTATE